MKMWRRGKKRRKRWLASRDSASAAAWWSRGERQNYSRWSNLLNKKVLLGNATFKAQAFLSSTRRYCGGADKRTEVVIIFNRDVEKSGLRIDVLIRPAQTCCINFGCKIWSALNHIKLGKVSTGWGRYLLCYSWVWPHSFRAIFENSFCGFSKSEHRNFCLFADVVGGFHLERYKYVDGLIMGYNYYTLIHSPLIQIYRLNAFFLSTIFWESPQNANIQGDNKVRSCLPL